MTAKKKLKWDGHWFVPMIAGFVGIVLLGLSLYFLLQKFTAPVIPTPSLGKYIPPPPPSRVENVRETLFQTYATEDFDNLSLDDLPGGNLGHGICAAGLVGQTAWISPECGRVLKYDLNGNLLGISNPNVANHVRSIFVTENAIYLLDTERGLLQVDPTTSEVIKIYAVEARSNVDLWAGGKYVWVSDFNRLWRIDLEHEDVQEIDIKSLGFTNPSPSDILISYASGVTYFSPADNAKYPNEGIAMYNEADDQWGYIRRDKFTEQLPKIRHRNSGALRGVWDTESWPNSYFNVEFNDNGVTTTVPTMIREYLALARYDEDTYYLGSSAGIEVFQRGALTPIVRAQVDPKSFPTGNGESHLLISPSKRYVTHLSIGIGLLGQIEIFGYDAVTYDLESHSTTLTHAKVAGIEEFEPRERGYIKGYFSVLEKSDRLTVTLNGKRIFDIHPKK